MDTSKVKWAVKLKMSTATKKELGVSFGEAIMQCSSCMFCHIFSVVSLEKMCSLKKELVFIQKLLNKYVDLFGSLEHNIYNISEVYYPLLLHMRRDEVSNLLYDIFKLAEGCKFYLRNTYDVPSNNGLIRVLFAFGDYFRAVITRNEEFKDDHRKPHNMWKCKDLH